MPLKKHARVPPVPPKAGVQTGAAPSSVNTPWAPGDAIQKTGKVGVYGPSDPTEPEIVLVAVAIEAQGVKAQRGAGVEGWVGDSVDHCH